MSEKDYHRGLVEAHRLLTQEAGRIGRQLEQSNALFGLIPSREQLELIGASKVLVRLSEHIVAAGGDSLARTKITSH